MRRRSKPHNIKLEDIAKVAEMLANGVDRSTISTQTTYPETEINRFAAILGIRKPMGRPVGAKTAYFKNAEGYNRALHPTYTEVSEAKRWAIIGCLNTGMWISAITARHDCTKDDVLKICDDLGMTFDAAKKIRVGMIARHGKNWKQVAYDTAMWQDAPPVV